MLNKWQPTGHISELPGTWQRPRPHVQPMAAVHPSLVEKLSSLNGLEMFQEIYVFHDKYPIVLFKKRSETGKLSEYARPAPKPWLKAFRASSHSPSHSLLITPTSSPFTLSPWVPYLQEFLATKIDTFKDGVRMSCSRFKGISQSKGIKPTNLL